MRTLTKQVYTFDELPTAAAKEKARQWMREGEGDMFGSHGELTEPVETAAELIGIDLATHSVRLNGGGTREEPKVWWSLHVQGSGASFEGTYAYAKESVKKLKEEFPKDEKLHAIVEGLGKLQKANGYKLRATVTTSGREVHQYAMNIDAYKGDEYASDEIKTELLELLRDFASWIYKYIDAEWDYKMSDESIDDMLRANEYEFTEEGKRCICI